MPCRGLRIGALALTIGACLLVASEGSVRTGAAFVCGIGLATIALLGRGSRAKATLQPDLLESTLRVPPPARVHPDLLDARRTAIAGASHDLRTPLTSILAAVEIVKRYADEDSATRTEFTDIIEHEARRLLGFVTNLLEADKIESGAIELHRADHDLGPIVEQVAAQAFARLREGGVALTLDKPTGTLTCNFDGARMEQLVRSMLEEAIRWSPRGGIVRIVVTKRDDALELSIRDEGPVPKAASRKIAAAADTTVRERNLAFEVCRAIADLHGFTMRCAADLERGCIYELLIPLAACREDAKANASAEPVPSFAYES